MALIDGTTPLPSTLLSDAFPGSIQDIIRLARRLNADMTQEELQLAITELSSENGITLSPGEAEQFYRSWVGPMRSENENGGVSEAFLVFDADGDGLISAEELGQALIRLGHVREGGDIEFCREMIRAVDRNGDGFVDFEEFKLLIISRSAPSP